MHVESIIRVSEGEGRPFPDVPLSKKVAAPSAPSTPKAAASSDGKRRHHQTPSPLKRSGSPFADAATRAMTTPKKARNSTSPAKAASTESVPKSPLKRPTPRIIQQRPHSEETRSQHEGEMKEIETHIARTTKHHGEALKQFQAASKLLTQAGWSRCTTMESNYLKKNINHPDYNVLETRRDGKCMYYCFLNILKAEGVTNATTTVDDLRNELATYVETQDPPPGMKKGPHGGIYVSHDNAAPVYIQLEESLGRTYGGEAAIHVFSQLHNVTIHCHAPESRNTIEMFQGQNPNGNEYNMLQTCSWKTWDLVVKKNPKTLVETTSYARNYAGDHWQLLEHKNRGSAKKLQFDDTPTASSASAAVITMRSKNVDIDQLSAAAISPQPKIANIDPKNSKKLLCDEPPASSCPTALKRKHEINVNIGQKKLNFSASSSTAPATRIEPNMANIDASLEFSDSLAVQFMLRHVSGSN